MRTSNKKIEKLLEDYPLDTFPKTNIKRTKQQDKETKKMVKSEEAEDRCKRRADSVYGNKTSAYKSGAIVRCRKGKIWKKKK